MLAASLAGCGAKEQAAPAGSSAAPAETKAAVEQTQAEAKPEAKAEDTANLSEVEKIIKEAEGMTMEELAKKAIEESNGKTFYGVGNSSRGKPHCRCSSSTCRRSTVLYDGIRVAAAKEQ